MEVIKFFDFFNWQEGEPNNATYLSVSSACHKSRIEPNKPEVSGEITKFSRKILRMMSY